MSVQMGIVKVEVNLPEAIRAIEEFRQNRKKAFDSITSELRHAVGHAISRLIQSEMTLFLGKPEQTGNKRNGFKERDYALKGVGNNSYSRCKFGISKRFVLEFWRF